MKNNSKTDQSHIIAVCGKGGVGKTSLSAAIVKILVEKKIGKVLAIDADPAVGLATALGINVRRTLDDIRNDIINRIKEGKSSDKKGMVSLIDYELFDAIEESNNLGFLAIGRPETEGCYCQLNHLLKDLIKSTANNFDFVLIDGEAGIEQINRRVMEEVDYLLLISDASVKGINVIKDIKKVADRAVNYEKIIVILNRLRSKDEADNIIERIDLDVVGWIPEDDTIRSYDIEGRSIMTLPECPALNALEETIDKVGIF